MVESAKQIKEPWGMNAQLLTITPHLASIWLGENKLRNRPLKAHHIAYLAECMCKGEWRINGEPIIKSRNGNLLDGQHRLTAVVESGITIKSWIVFGVDEECFHTIDSGRSRIAADVLGFSGYKNATTLAAAVRILDLYITGQMEKRWHEVRLSGEEYLELIKRYPSIIESVDCCAGNKQIKALMPPSVSSFTHYLFGMISQTARDYFFSHLADGADLPKYHPILALRDRLISNRASKGKLSQLDLCAIVIKAWNSYRRGNKLKCLKWTRSGESVESFPEAI